MPWLKLITWRRALAVALATVLACLLHCAALMWFDNLPAPLPVTEAKALPMIVLPWQRPPQPHRKQSSPSGPSQK